MKKTAWNNKIGKVSDILPETQLIAPGMKHFHAEKCLTGVREAVRKISALLVAVPLALCSAPAFASDPGQSGFATFIGSNPMSQLWNIEMDSLLKTSLVNSNGIVTVAVSGGFDIICIENATGSILWKTRSPNLLSGVPEISATRGLIIASTKLGSIDAYSIKTGEKVYTVATGWDESSSPTLSEKHLIVRGFDTSDSRSGVSAMNIDTGKIVWQSSTIPSSQPPCASNGVVYLLEKKAVKAMKEIDGSLKWKNELPFSPEFISARGKTIAITSGTDIHFLDLENGRIEKTKSFDSKIVRPPSFFDGLCYIITDSGKQMTCFDISSGADIWKTEADSEYFQPQVWINGLVATTTSCVQIVDRQTGKLLWDVSVVGKITANPVAIVDYMIIPTTQKLYAFRNAGFEIHVVSNSLDLGLMTSDEPFSSSNMQVFNRSGSIQKISCQSKSSWLKVMPDTFEIKPHDAIELLLSADMREEPFGSYNAKVEITWSTGIRELTVAARKVTPQEAKPPKPGKLQIIESNHDYSSRLGKPNPSFVQQISNVGDVEIDYTLSTISPWILISNPSGKLRGKETRKLTVCLLTSKAQMGKNDGLITLTSTKSGQSFDIFVTFWRDPGVMKVVATLELGSSVASISGIKVRARPEPYLSNKTIMVPLSFVQLLLDCRLDEEKGGVYKLIRGNVSIIATVGSDTAEIFTPSKMQKLRLASPVAIKKGCVVLPLEVIRFAYDGLLNYDGKTATLELNLDEL